MAVSTPPSIRRRTRRDCESVVSWIDNATDLYLFTGPRLRWPVDVAQLHEMNQVAGLSAWVLVDVTTSEVVGHFDVTLADSTASLGRVIIDPKRRGQGYAHTLVNHAISLTRQLGASLLSLNVIVGNDTAIHVYEQAGFCKTDSNERPGVHKMTLRLAATR